MSTPRTSAEDNHPLNPLSENNDVSVNKPNLATNPTPDISENPTILSPPTTIMKSSEQQQKNPSTQPILIKLDPVELKYDWSQHDSSTPLQNPGTIISTTKKLQRSANRRSLTISLKSDLPTAKDVLDGDAYA